MPDQTNNATPANLKPWANDLACPVCFAGLQFSASAVLCTACGRNYPVVDGIPVLIPGRATAPCHK
jgi:uncharacterized protein YbaR (Trm112 family)